MGCPRLGSSYRKKVIKITENIRKAFDYENIGCSVFVDLQKDFDIVDHQILFSK